MVSLPSQNPNLSIHSSPVTGSCDLEAMSLSTLGLSSIMVMILVTHIRTREGTVPSVQGYQHIRHSKLVMGLSKPSASMSACVYVPI
jgi:hypothetical protein